MERIELTLDDEAKITTQTIKNICDYFGIKYLSLPIINGTELINIDGVKTTNNLFELLENIFEKETQKAYDMGVADGLNNRIKEQ